MKSLSHTAECAEHQGERQVRLLTFKVALYPETKRVTVDIAESCSWCGTQVGYNRATMPLWKWERQLRGAWQVWWATFAHRNGAWEHDDDLGNPPF